MALPFFRFNYSKWFLWVITSLFFFSLNFFLRLLRVVLLCVWDKVQKKHNSHKQMKHRMEWLNVCAENDIKINYTPPVLLHSPIFRFVIFSTNGTSHMTNTHHLCHQIIISCFIFLLLLLQFLLLIHEIICFFLCSRCSLWMILARFVRSLLFFLFYSPTRLIYACAKLSTLTWKLIIKCISEQIYFGDD